MIMSVLQKSFFCISFIKKLCELMYHFLYTILFWNLAMNHPTNLKYASTHEWIKQEDDYYITGISDHAQNSLGDLVYIELPKVGQVIKKGQQVGVVESVKTASDIHAPISGTVIEVNSLLDEDPDFINEDCYGQGWIYKIKPDAFSLDVDLLNSFDYENQI